MVEDPAGTAFERHYAQVLRYLRRRTCTAVAALEPVRVQRMRLARGLEAVRERRARDGDGAAGAGVDLSSDAPGE